MRTHIEFALSYFTKVPFLSLYIASFSATLLGLSFPGYTAAPPEDVHHRISISLQQALENEKINSQAALATSFRAMGSNLQTQSAKQSTLSFAQSTAQQHVSNAVGSFLSQFGTANLRLNAGAGLQAEGSEFDFLLPLYDTNDSLSFSQIGTRRLDSRTMVNAGMGQRYWFSNKMVGFNLFFDRDLSHQHSRLGIGFEFSRDNLRFLGNAYLPLSNWKTSPAMEDYLERPARGFDLRSEAWLPAFPALGGKIVYTRYYGQEVGLSGHANRFKSPEVIDASILFNPIPLVTFEAGQRTLPGKGRSETLFGLTLSYSPGTPLKQQLRTDAVRQRHLLSGSRYNLIERNNYIVLEYQKSSPLTLALPSHLVRSGDIVDRCSGT